MAARPKQAQNLLFLLLLSSCLNEPCLDDRPVWNTFAVVTLWRDERRPAGARRHTSHGKFSQLLTPRRAPVAKRRRHHRQNGRRFTCTAPIHTLTPRHACRLVGAAGASSARQSGGSRAPCHHRRSPSLFRPPAAALRPDRAPTCSPSRHAAAAHLHNSRRLAGEQHGLRPTIHFEGRREPQLWRFYEPGTFEPR